MGVVYRSTHPRLEIPVAIKVLAEQYSSDQSFRQRFHREAATVAALNHPGIVRVVDHGLSDGVPWYAMELLNGRTLRSHNEGVGSVPTLLDDRTPVPPASGEKRREGSGAGGSVTHHESGDDLLVEAGHVQEGEAVGEGAEDAALGGKAADHLAFLGI